MAHLLKCASIEDLAQNLVKGQGWWWALVIPALGRFSKMNQ